MLSNWRLQPCNYEIKGHWLFPIGGSCFQPFKAVPLIPFCSCRSWGFPLRGEGINSHGHSGCAIRHTEGEKVQLKNQCLPISRALNIFSCWIRHLLIWFWFCDTTGLRSVGLRPWFWLDQQGGTAQGYGAESKGMYLNIGCWQSSSEFGI